MNNENSACMDLLKQLQKNLRAVEDDRAQGFIGYSIDELDAFLDIALNEE